MNDQQGDPTANPEQPGPHNVSDEELEAAFQLPSTFVTKTIVTASGTTARITFFEVREIGGERKSFARASVSMSLADLVQLRDLITDLQSKFRQVPIAVQDESDGDRI